MELWENAQWIFAQTEGEAVDRYFEYLVQFEADPGQETTLYISAHTQYAVYINDAFAECGQYDDYEDYQVYDTIPVTKWLREKENFLLIRQYVRGEDFSSGRKQIPGVIFTIRTSKEELCYSRPDCQVREDKRFLSQAEKMTPQFGFNFDYDANVQLTGYVPCRLAGKEKHLYPRPVKRLKKDRFLPGMLKTQGVFREWNAEESKAKRCQHAWFCAVPSREFAVSPKALKDASGASASDLTGESKTSFSFRMPEEYPGDGVYLIYDLGGEKVGYPEFLLVVPEACEVLVAIGEHLEDLRVRSFVGGRNFAFRYQAKKGENRFFYPFAHFGLRYLQFMIYSREGNVAYAGVREAVYPLEKQNSLCLSGMKNGGDRLYEKIWEAGLRTLRLCMHEHYEDCPWREQSLYTMDSRIQMLCGYYAFEEYEFPKANLRLIAHSLRKDHLLELCSPGKVPVNIPCFTAVFPRQVLEYIQYSGDRAFAGEMLPVLREITEGFAEMVTQKGLIPQLPGKWNFYEWRVGLDGDGGGKEPCPVYDSLLNAFVSDAFGCTTQLIQIAMEEDGGKNKKEPELEMLRQRLNMLREKINDSIHRHFFREAYGGYATFLSDKKPVHALTQAMVLYVGAVPEAFCRTVAEGLREEKWIPCSLSMTIYEFDALMQVSGEYRTYILSKIEELWGRMLESGSDTFWETDLGAEDFEDAGSLCHGWSAVPVYFFKRYGQ